MGELGHGNSIIYNKGKRDAYDEVLDLVKAMVFQHEYVSEDLFYGYVTALKDIYGVVCHRYVSCYGPSMGLEEEEEDKEHFVDSIQREIHEDGRVTYRRRNISI